MNYTYISYYVDVFYTFSHCLILPYKRKQFLSFIRQLRRQFFCSNNYFLMVLSNHFRHCLLLYSYLILFHVYYLLLRITENRNYHIEIATKVNHFVLMVMASHLHLYMIYMTDLLDLLLLIMDKNQ